MTRADTEGPWQPLSPMEGGSLFAGFRGMWAIAGGWAIDLFLGEPTRPHADLDILILRHDLDHMHSLLVDWELFGANSGELTAWPAGARLDPTTHDIWCRRAGGPWEFQLMVGEATSSEWIYRRDPAIRGPIADLVVDSAAGLPVLAPEIQLLYKSRTPRPKDLQDFHAVLPRLGDHRRAWLATTLHRTDPDNPWIDALINWKAGPVRNADDGTS